MESIDGHLKKFIVDDSAEPAPNVLYSSAKMTPLATEGTFKTPTTANSNISTLTTKVDWVTPTSLVIPATGRWLLWMKLDTMSTVGWTALRFAVNGVTAATNSLSLILWATDYTLKTGCVCLNLKKGDVVTFPVQSSNIGVMKTGTYCFEFLHQWM